MMIDYSNKVCLAPMVRSGELPMRLFALKNNCDLVWTPEYIDKKIITTKRIENKELGTIDYITRSSNNTTDVVVFRKHPLETGKLIFQMGSSDPSIAVDAALHVIQDVDGIDLNCGCPKHFSIHSKMGAELLKDPELLCSILINLVEKVGKPNNKPISAKIRLLPNFEKTKGLIEKILSTGISNLTIHCRTPIMRNRQDPIWNYLPKLIPMIQDLGVNLILNGNFQSRDDLKSVQEALKNFKLSIMIAEAVEANPSILSSTPKVQKFNVAEIAELGMKYLHFSGAKFMILNMIPGKSKWYQELSRLKNWDDMMKKIDEMINDNDTNDKINFIMNKNNQKVNLLNVEEFKKLMRQRGELMKLFNDKWDEEKMLDDLNDALPENNKEQQKQKQKGKKNKKNKKANQNGNQKEEEKIKTEDQSANSHQAEAISKQVKAEKSSKEAVTDTEHTVVDNENDSTTKKHNPLDTITNENEPNRKKVKVN
ncbi:unnamed protein product [Candida verbasci]|uniref:DUS-like FMN-binding domain-containing protein n=1 Tax=Candida verbasci TaxID=1227364 RepID=A0A9W4TX29_9ASCO|nr:unnamed protein product [Candida verbasci]